MYRLPTLSLILCLFVVSAPAQERVRNLTTADGLPNRYVNAVAQDSLGFMWFGTSDGLARYDGRRFVVYKQGDGPGDLRDDLIHALLVTRDGKLWVGTAAAGLHRFDHQTETFTWYPPTADSPTRLAFRHINTLTEDIQGRIWIGGSRGNYPDWIDILDPVTNHVIHIQEAGTPLLSGWPTLHTRNGFLVSVGGFWAAAERASLTNFDGHRFHLFPLPIAHDCHPIGLRQSASDLFVGISCDGGSNGGLLRYEAGTDSFVRVISGWTESPRQLLILGRDLWFHTLHGVYRVPLNDLPAHLPSPIVAGHTTDMVRDRAGNLWVGSAQGVYQISTGPATFQTLDETVLANPDVNAMLVGPDSMLWIGTMDGLVRLDRRTGQLETFYLPPSGIWGTRIWSLAFDTDGKLLVGTGGRGLYRFSGGHFQRVGALGDHESVRHFFQEPDGKLWMGSSHGLVRRDPASGQYEAYRHDPNDSNSLPNNAVNAIHRDHRGRLWIGTDDGLARWDETNERIVERYTPGDGSGLTNNFVWAIHEDADGILWVGTVGGGLQRFDPDTGQFEAYSMERGLSHEAVYGILPEPGSTALWVSTGHGLNRFDPVSETFEYYTSADGLASNDFNLMAYHAAGDEIFFGSSKGLTYFRPAEIRLKDTAAPLTFTGLRVFDEERPGMLTSGETIRLEPGENFFTVGFGSLDFEPLRSHRYRYRLEGYETRWHTATDENPEAAYTGVAPGRYRLVVQGLGRRGEAVSEAAIEVIVEPHWYQRKTVQALGILLLILLVVGVMWNEHRRRISRVEENAIREREALQRLALGRDMERQRLARELHDGPLQELYGIGHRLDELAINGRAAEVKEARRVVTDVARELRGVCSELRPPMLAHFGPVSALRAHAEHLANLPNAPHITFEARTNGRALSEAAQLAIFRIGQEALNNAVHHAAAGRVKVSFTNGDNGATLVVEDDGRGFRLPSRLATFARAEHFGLIGARERAESVGGRLNVDSTPGQGTRVEVLLPVEAARSDGRESVAPETTSL